MDGSRFAVLIPAHNEAATIARIVREARHFGEVFVVNDGSADETGDLARAAGAVVLSPAAPAGYDGAINHGLAAIRDRGFEAVAVMDADGEHDPRFLGAFRDLLLAEGKGLVVGIRPRRQRVLEVLFALYGRVFYGVDDILCGMKGYRLAALEEYGVTRIGDGIATSATLDLVQAGVSFHQIPICGELRRDAPRFGSAFRANWKILKVLLARVHVDALCVVARSGHAGP